jgi:hypothetical protein
MQHEIRHLDRKGLREFGIVTGAIVAGLFGLFFPWLLEIELPLWPWILAAVLIGWALLAPATLQPVYRGWMRVGLLIGTVTTPLILGIAFLALFVPTGLIMRALGRDPMARELDDRIPSYRVPSHERDAKHMERPF